MVMVWRQHSLEMAVDNYIQNSQPVERGEKEGREREYSPYLKKGVTSHV